MSSLIRARGTERYQPVWIKPFEKDYLTPLFGGDGVIRTD